MQWHVIEPLDALISQRSPASPCLFIDLFVRSFVCLFVWSFVRSCFYFVGLVVLFVLFVCLCFRTIYRQLVGMWVCSCLCKSFSLQSVMFVTSILLVGCVLDFQGLFWSQLCRATSQCIVSQWSCAAEPLFSFVCVLACLFVCRFFRTRINRQIRFACVCVCACSSLRKSFSLQRVMFFTSTLLVGCVLNLHSSFMSQLCQYTCP